MDSTELYLILSDRNRRRILDLVLGGERTVTDLIRATRLHQPLVSHHLRVLREAGLVKARREGRFRLYGVASADIARALAKAEEAALAVLAAAEETETVPADGVSRAPSATAALRARKRKP